METIKTYLENMFINLPGTPAVYKAKKELLSMMEDKYIELKNEGKTENEAVGIVISEFGNLQELAADLGLDKVMDNVKENESKKLSLEEVKEFLSDYARHASLVSIGVMLCILSVCGPMLSEVFVVGTRVNEDAAYALGCALMFVIIAVAVGLFAYSGMSLNKWKSLEKELHMIDYNTSQYVDDIWEKNRKKYAFKMTVGVVMCVVSIVPVIISEALPGNTELYEDAAAVLLFILVADGVRYIVSANIKNGSIKKILNINDSRLVGGNYTKAQKETAIHYSNKKLEAVMSVYWTTVTCIYLSISFLTFSWHITWIIWPVAAIIHSLIKNVARED